MSALHPRRAPRAAAAAVLATVLMVACGGGGGDAPPEPPPPAGHVFPSSALASPEAYTRYALGLAPSDTASPLSLETVGDPPTSDTALPLDFD